MNKTVLIAIISLFLINTNSAQVVPKQKNITIESEILGEERELKICLPKGYTEEQSYPVIYITDGATLNYEVALNYLNVLSEPAFNIIPPSILVGIKQKNRQNELRVYGGYKGEKFKKHIFDELVPFIDSTYSTSGFNAIIGHSDGAEYNQFLLISDNNPFRGFVSVSTAFNWDLKDEITQFFKTYDGSLLYYFIANGTRDPASRIEAGNSFEALYKNSPNKNIAFEKRTYPGDHQSIVALSLLDGFLFIFQDYKNIEKYTSIIDYGENYLNDLMKAYGIIGSYSIGDTELFWEDIFNHKKVDEYHYMSNFYEDHFGITIDPLNHANNYFEMDLYPEAIEFYNQALEEIETLTPGFFYQNIFRAVNAYKAENRLAEAITFLEKSREKLPDKYMLNMSYYIAELSLNNQVAVKKGRKALAYCKANYRKNSLFTMDDVIELERQ
jgi:predicted alpha/beta superfamily hydrolase